MADKRNDGGPAFPMQQHGIDGLPDSEACWGMTLRDWFAGQALMGWCADPHMGSFVKVAEGCYNMADAMLAEREKRDDQEI